ncbi:galactoside 2-alpha-L-fucosyltransferase [Elaeis guineensis]|uniref:Fucosyltransferase n=1 Tax=Elaeis guineensis var. tenera TaxID=51953 RepID=A0A6I9S8H7_ELAGV|nr:galactoside 2-alpha-L-fucosyltransferase [Elaeis guineensis]
MDLKRIRRPQPSPAEAPDPESNGPFRPGTEKRPASGFVRPAVVLLACLVLLLVISSAHRSSSLDPLRRAGGVQEKGKFEVISTKGSEKGSSASSNIPKDKLLAGLLDAGFDEGSCLSRYQAVLYRKESPHLPSPYLLERLRKHEALQKKCGPNTELYNKAVEQLKSGQTIESTECNYVVWISYSGLGNRILTLASAFLYSLLTNRVLLIDRGADLADLFCEPFPETSWLLPLDFPVNQFNSFDIKAPQSYGNMLEKKVISNSVDGASMGSLPAYAYLHLAHDYGDFDKLFFCEDDQRVLQKIPWLVLRSDNYFVPSLFLIPTYEEELSQLFPKKDTVFHHLGRYLFHPTNRVWGLITRYYQSYLSKAKERVGIQIRVFDTGIGPFQHVLDQILGCSLKEKLLPGINAQDSVVSTSDVTSKAVIVTSLHSGYFEKIRNMYWEHPTITGEIVGVYQPSHEGYQQTEKQMHNMKAWAEMYLLSLTDELVTSAWSTFGYVAQGLGGLKPWIMFKPENQTAPDPPCRRVMSMEPCFHAPPFYDCKAKRGVDTGALVPHVKHCEDMSWGLKLVDQDEW